jgi:hypothetical protein
VKYYKNIEDGYISAIGTGIGDVEITQEEHENILSVIQSKPVAETGYDYRLRTDLTWELVEAPIVEDDAEATEADYLEALERLGVSE